jgi:hypothetical protein
VTPLCVGTSALGSFPAQYGYEVSPERAVATMRRVFEGPINFIASRSVCSTRSGSEMPTMVELIRFSRRENWSAAAASGAS